jgi:hypothetical protein
MIDLVIAEPSISQREIARVFNKSEGWVSLIFNSDAFLARLAERKAELVDPEIVATVKERLQVTANLALQALQAKLERHPDVLKDDFVLRAAEVTTKALGYGARAESSDKSPRVAVVVQVPPRIPDAGDWANKYGASVEVLNG